MNWTMTLLIACIILSLCLGQSMSALGAVNPNFTVSTSVPLARSLGAASTALPTAHTTSSYKAIGQKLAASSSAATSSTGLSAAASSQAVAGTTTSNNAGSEVVVLAQVIIAIGVLPIEVLIVTTVLLIHRLMHRRPSRPLPTSTDSTKPRRESRDSIPYLQPKAELEDEERRRHELNGELIVHELDCEDEIFQMPDETESLFLPLQGRERVYELPEGGHMSWEMPLQGRHEVMGDEHAQELECPSQGREEPIRVGNAEKLRSLV